MGMTARMTSHPTLNPKPYNLQTCHLGGLVVVRDDGEDGVASNSLGLLRQGNGLLGAVAASTGHDLHGRQFSGNPSWKIKECEGGGRDW